jgi:hypothetical protein
MRSITDKDMDRARKAALKRLGRGIDKAIVNAATGTVLTQERLIEEHIGREQELLARIGYKLHTRNVRGIAEVAAEAPTPASLFEDARELWNTEADEIEARFTDGFFPLRLRPTSSGTYRFAPAAPRQSSWQHWGHSVEVLIHCSVLEQKCANEIGAKAAKQELLARIGYKSAEAPTPASLFEDARELWNTEADEIEARLLMGSSRCALDQWGAMRFAPCDASGPGCRDCDTVRSGPLPRQSRVSLIGFPVKVPLVTEPPPSRSAARPRLRLDPNPSAVGAASPKCNAVILVTVTAPGP